MSEPEKPTPLGPRPGQLTIRRMMLLTALLAVAAAVFGGLARGGIRQRTLVIVSLAAPVGIMIGLSLWVQWRGRRR